MKGLFRIGAVALTCLVMVAATGCKKDEDKKDDKKDKESSIQVQKHFV